MSEPGLPSTHTPNSQNPGHRLTSPANNLFATSFPGATSNRRQTSRLASSKGQRMVQACDCCRKRKIKCDTRQPSCANCENAGILCQTLRTSQKRGRKAVKSPSATSRATDLARQQVQPQHGSNESDYAISQCEQSTGDRTSRPSPEQFVNIANGMSQLPQSGPQYFLSPSFCGAGVRDGDHGRGEMTHPHPSPQHFDQGLTGADASPRMAENSFAISDFHPLLAEMAQEMFAAGFTQSVSSYISTYVDLFFDNIYPIYPVVYRPTIQQGIELLSTPTVGWDSKMFSLITSLCAYTCAILPPPTTAVPWPIPGIFYRASKKALDLYRDEDIESPDSTSIVIRSFHSGWIHASGKSNASWHIMGEAVRIAQVMRLHDETSYARMTHLEGQLCRRVFWTLFTGDKSAAILGGHPICLNSDFFQNGITTKYPEDFPDQDILNVTAGNGIDVQLSIMSGFNANQDLWRAAEALLAWDADEVARIGATTTNITTTKLSHLVSHFIRFRTCLDNLPSSLHFHSFIDLSPADFTFSNQIGRKYVPRALAIQRTNLHISYQCLKMVILRKFPILYSNPIMDCLENAPPLQLQSFDMSNPASRHGIGSCKGHNTPAFILETLQIAEDMLYIIYTSTLELIRVNGESCVEKIRLVGAAILELIANNPSSSLAIAAGKYRELYPHLLALLESKASDRVEYTSKKGSGDIIIEE